MPQTTVNPVIAAATTVAQVGVGIGGCGFNGRRLGEGGGKGRAARQVLLDLASKLKSTN